MGGDPQRFEQALHRNAHGQKEDEKNFNIISRRNRYLTYMHILVRPPEKQNQYDRGREGRREREEGRKKQREIEKNRERD